MKPPLMRRAIPAFALLCSAAYSGARAEERVVDYPYVPVPFTAVQAEGGFWGPRMEVHHKTTIPHALDALEKNGHITNFDKAAGKFDGELRGHHAFDSDLHKAMDGFWNGPAEGRTCSGCGIVIERAGEFDLANA